MSNKIYRVLDEESGTYISKVAGFIRSEKYTNVDSAYVYSKEQATKIVKLMNYMRTHMLKEENAALGTASSPVMISEILAKDIDSKEYILFLFSIYNKWNKLPMVFRGYTPDQVKWFMKKFGNRIYNEKSTVDWWRNTY